jgi:hypothetical protein
LKIRYLLTTASLLVLSHAMATAQTYRNVVNTRFNTISNGPMQALIVDVPNAKDTKSVEAAVAAKVIAARKSRESGLKRELDIMRRTFKWKGELAVGIPDIVVVRENGRLALPTTRAATRAGGDITFNFPISAAANDGGWTVQQAQELAGFRDRIYPVLKTIYGAPSWSGTVTVVNGDNQSPIITDPNALSAGIYDVTNSKITFAQYNLEQTKVLFLSQMMAIAFHGPASISYDAWERGMARAAAMEVARNLKGTLAVIPDDPLFHALDRYELMNQPPLGNDRFFPVAKAGGVANTATFPNMMLPRLTMAGSAWLKAETEAPGFLAAFNTAYYAAVASDPTIKNNVQALKTIAASVLPNIEGLPFADWYQRQYVLDTSISPGVKLYAQVTVDRHEVDDPAFAIVLFYYNTSVNSQGTSDETNLSGTSFPIYWDYLYSSRLFLAAQYERVDIRDGLGAIAPTFPNTITPVGGDPQLEGRQRITIDFPVNAENVRLYVAPRDMGTEVAPNTFWGTVVGADTGTMRIQTDLGTDTTVQVKQGSFSTILPSPAFTRPTRATLTFTDSNNVVTTRRTNIGYDEYIPVFYVSDPVQSLTHTFPAGPAMISFPISPLQQRAEQALLNPANDQPLFNSNNLLLAQWRQNVQSTDGDKYLRYPALEPLTPGKGYWENFGGATAVKIKGKITTPDQDVSIALLAGWNQIGNPYQQPINITQLQFQYLADNVSVDLATAITRGWIVAQTIPTVGQVAIFDYDSAQGYIPATTLEPWKGYWIRVLVSEGVTITYPNPTPGGRSVKRVVTRSAAVKAPSGWTLPIVVRGPIGTGATAWIGQSNQAEGGANLKMNALLPPAFTRSVPAISFPHPELGANAGDYITDIRKNGVHDPWEISVYTPDPTKTYSISWANLSNVPRGTRLILVDKSTGQRQYLNSSSGYSFTPGTGSTRAFQIVAEDRTGNSLRIFNITSRTSRAAGTMQIDYQLSQGATVTTEIRGANGQVVRRLSSGRAASSGNNSTLWDQRDDKATPVAAGTYFINITAQTPEGEKTRIVQPVIIVR